MSQAFAPGGWTTLQHGHRDERHRPCLRCGAHLRLDRIQSAAPSRSTAPRSAADLSGVIIEFQIAAPSPIPAANNPNWPYLKFEAAFNGGFQTPPDQLTWTDLSNRLWSWDETTGVQYQLGEIQATELDLELDNYDNALASAITWARRITATR